MISEVKRSPTACVWRSGTWQGAAKASRSVGIRRGKGRAAWTVAASMKRIGLSGLGEVVLHFHRFAGQHEGAHLGFQLVVGLRVARALVQVVGPGTHDETL